MSVCANDNNDNNGNNAMPDEVDLSRGLVERLSNASPEFRVALDALIHVGCDAARLGWLLRVLIGRKGSPAVSRQDMEAFASVLNDASKTVWKLYFSQAGVLLAVNFSLAGQLGLLARQVEALAPDTDARRETAFDMGVAMLIKYVHDLTGEYHDNEVASMMSVALIDAGLRNADYTTNAHTRWRGRSSHTRFTEGDGLKRVTEALEAMDDELWPPWPEPDEDYRDG